MPTAYDLSSVIAGGSSVGHNNLIPLGEPPGLRAFCLTTFASSPGAELPPQTASPPCSAGAAPTLPTSVSAHRTGHVGQAGWGR